MLNALLLSGMLFGSHDFDVANKKPQKVKPSLKQCKYHKVNSKDDFTRFLISEGFTIADRSETHTINIISYLGLFKSECISPELT